MKLALEIEDIIIGTICGLLLIGYSGKYFSLKLPPFAYIIAFGIFTIFIILDVVNELSDLSTHFGFIALAIIHNIVDFIIALAVISHFGKFSIPYITSTLVPYLQNDVMFYYAGIFLIVSNVLWIFTYAFS